MRILVVDDIPLIRRIIKRMLREHEVVECGSGAEALDVLGEDDQFDVILSDMNMGGMDGASFYTNLELRQPLLCSRVVFVSGGGATSVQAQFLRTTSRPVVSKPIDVQDLNIAIDMIGAGVSYV